MIVEKCKDTGLYVGYIPGIPGAHTQAETLEELEENMKEVLDLLNEEGVNLESSFVSLISLDIGDKLMRK